MHILIETGKDNIQKPNAVVAYYPPGGLLLLR